MPIDLVALTLLPSSANLISSALSGAAHAAGSWLVKKALDVTFKCGKCSEPRQERIENVASNELYCHNCARSVMQFTNACKVTVGPKGEIAHVGLELGTPVFLDRPISWGMKEVQVNTTFRSRGLKREQLVSCNTLKYLETDEHLHTSMQLVTPQSNDESATVWLKAKYAASERMIWTSGTIYKLDVEIRSKYDDVLCRDRMFLEYSFW